MKKKTEKKKLDAKILVIDDDPIIRLALKSFLESQDCEVHEADNGTLALQKFERESYDFVLLDTVMPGMDGFEVCEAIRRHERGGEIPIIMITVMNDEASIEKGFGAGASDYIPKPFNWSLLLYRLKNLVERLHSEERQKQLQLKLQRIKKIEAIGQASRGIAHEFNNLLTTILGYTNLSLEQYAQQGDGKLYEYLTEVQTAGSRAHALVKKMLAYSHDDAGLPEVLDPALPVAELVAARRQSKPAHIVFEDRLEPELPPIKIDPGLLGQAVDNLLDNAFEAVGTGGFVAVGLRRYVNLNKRCESCLQEVSGDYIEIFVQDNGSAIDPQVMERIFDPFFSTKEMAEGMGLSIVHGIVHRNHGHVLVESEPEKGTLVRLLFPVYTESGELQWRA